MLDNSWTMKHEKPQSKLDSLNLDNLGSEGSSINDITVVGGSGVKDFVTTVLRPQ